MFSKPFKSWNKKRSTIAYEVESYITPLVILKTWAVAYFCLYILFLREEEEISTVLLLTVDEETH